ncbi:MAG: hypothetical protein EBR32_06945, partial [Bacteroidetes bacterium]|nr:hypothetical protein [Bacteroidota bacterium]
MSINFVHIIQRHKHIIGTLYALFTSSILIGTLIPGSSLSEYEVFSYDKLMHLLAFMAWTLGTGICWRAYNNRRAPLKLLVVAPILFGDPQKKRSITDQSLLVRGYDVVAVNNDYGERDSDNWTNFWTILWSNYKDYAPYGIEKFRWDPKA